MTCEENPEYDPMDPRDAPEPEEERAVTNEFLQPTVRFLRVMLDNECYGRETLKSALAMLLEIPAQAAYCPVCADQFDAKDGAVPPPTVVRLRGCGHFCCDRCARQCAETCCANDGCADCMMLCEGHAAPMCHEHTVAKNYCKDCVPTDVRRERGRELAFIEE